MERRGVKSTENRQGQLWSWHLNWMGKRLPRSMAARYSSSMRPSRCKSIVRRRKKWTITGTKLSAGGDAQAQQCGWLKDKYGVSWQVVPTILIEMLSDPHTEKSQRAMEAMLHMKKIDIDTLKRAVGDG